MEICRENEIVIRDLENTIEDFEVLYNWLNNKNVSEFYGGKEEKKLEFVIHKYRNKIEDKKQFPCIIEYNGKNIGYIQFYYVNFENYDLSKEKFNKIADEQGNVMAIDVFIGDDGQRDKGIGTRVIKLLTNTLFKNYNIDTILIDPKTHNHRAINCYKKAGFKECFIAEKREEQDGIKYDNLIMKKENELFITTKIDRIPYEKKISDDKVINLTGESGSGKSYYSKQFNNDEYIIIDTDLIFENKHTENKESVQIRKLLIEKYGENNLNICDDFDIIYEEILQFFKSSPKTLVIDSAQFRNLKDMSLLIGKVIIIRTNVDKCYERCIERWIENRVKYYGEYSRRRIRKIQAKKTWNV